MLAEALRGRSLRTLLVPAAKRVPYPAVTDRAFWRNHPMRQQLLRRGEAALGGYPPLPASAYLAYARMGDRQAFEGPYFRRRVLLISAALAECVQDEGRYLDAVIDGLWCLCEESSWVISAHNGAADGLPGHEKQTPLPDTEHPYIDLFAAQTAATLAYTLYLLGPRLDAVTPMLRARIQKELEKRVFTPFRERDDFWWMGFIRKNLNNWTPWILSNVMDAFLLCEPDDDRLASALTRAIGMLDRYLASQPADGGCDEGVAYWNMAGASLLDCLETLGRATGGALDVYGEPIIKAIAAFPLKAHIAGPWFINFADCDAKPRLDGERVYTFGVRTQNPSLRALGLAICERNGFEPLPDTPQMRRLLDELCTRREPMQAMPEPERNTVLPALQLYTLERGRYFAAVKGGNNNESHNHNDVGSLICFVDGEPAVVDAGNLTYTAKTFSAERYTLWNTRAAYHNLPLIGGVEQQAGEKYRAAAIENGPGTVRLQLHTAYPPQIGLTRYTRSVTVGAEGITVRDKITLKTEIAVTWVWMLREEPVFVENGRLMAAGVRFGYTPSLTYAVEEIPITDARMACSYPGSLYRVTLAAAPVTRCEAEFSIQKG